jgi:signal transduction histidine kinase
VRDLPRLLVVAAVYYATARLGLEIASLADAVTLVWAPAGIGLAAVLRHGPAMLVATVPAHFAANLSVGSGAGFAAAAAAAGALEAASAAWLLRRMRFDLAFASLRDVAAFLSIGVIAAPALAASIGATALAASGRIAGGEWATAFHPWWIGDGMGALVVAPALLLAGRIGQLLADPREAFAPIGVGALIVLVCLVVFGGLLPVHGYPLSFVVLPVLVLAAYRFGPAGAAGATFLVACVALLGTLRGAGPFSGGSRDVSIALMQAFLGVASVTSLVLAALVAARDRTESELREAQQTLRAMEAATEAGTWVWRPERGMRLGSPQQRRLHGLAGRLDPIPQDDVLATIHPEDRARVVREFEEAWSARGRVAIEYRVVLPDGGIRWLAAQGVCLPVTGAKAEGLHQMVGVHVDVTARKEMEETVRRGERLASLGTFAAGVAHELNNPLGTILLAAETAHFSAHDPARIAGALDDIVEDTKRAARIVKSILLFARAETTERTLLDLSDCARRAADLTRSYCRERSVSLELRLAERGLWAVANATEIEQVLVNVIRNAAEACDPGGQIWVGAEGAGDALLLTVWDDGHGMTDAERARIFDPFYTTRAQRGGSGLGLSICHGIVAAHGGRIEVDSAPGTGTRVHLHLPKAGRDEKDEEGADGATPRG